MPLCPRPSIIVHLALATLLAVCATPLRAAPLPPAETTLLSRALAERIADRSIHTIPALHWRWLQAFYAARDDRPAWLGPDGPTTKAARLRATLLAARSEGLDPEDYFPDEIAQQWSARSPSSRVRLELLLSEAFLRYALDVSVGRLPPQMVDPNWHIRAPHADPVALLRHCLQARDFAAALAALPPPHAGYRRLRAALAHYRQIAAAGGWPTLPAGTPLRRGQSGPRITILRRRLAIDGDLTLSATEHGGRFDQAVAFAVERFQVRHGLKMDGVVGPATRAAMNVPVTARIAQIELNMQRWRWLPRHLGRRYIMVNTAGFELTAVERGRPRLTMRVVIGRPERATPVVSGQLHTIVLNPVWTVPPTITFQDFVPAQRRNPRFFASRHIQVFSNRLDGKPLDPASIDWARLNPEHFPYFLRQAPGPTNPLGRIEFLFSNDFDIYLHDSPHHRLFDRRQRAFSAGCIRVEHPLRLAQWVMDGRRHWTQAAFKAAIARGATRELSVPRAVPVYVVYWTAWVGEHGGLHFDKDVYASDCQMSDCPSDERPSPP